MLNKKLVLGSLAGATLLVGAAMMAPTVADAAGLMSGVCSGCHTMHNSVDGASVAVGKVNGDPGWGNLLLRNGCVGCHAYTTNDPSTGRAASAPKAPQVNDATNPLAGGYFSATDANIHNAGFGTTALPTAPGGTFATAGGFECQDCHGDAEGGHHSYGTAGSTRAGAVGDSYRMLKANSNNDTSNDGVYVTSGTTPDANYESTGTANDYTADMNLFCADCHGGFHGTTNQGSTSPFVRHPTEVATGGYGAGHTGSLQIPTTETTSEVMCISCHRPHGTGQPDLLRFTYANSSAGDLTQGVGCETCHGMK